MKHFSMVFWRFFGGIFAGAIFLLLSSIASSADHSSEAQSLYPDATSGPILVFKWKKDFFADRQRLISDFRPTQIEPLILPSEKEKKIHHQSGLDRIYMAQFNGRLGAELKRRLLKTPYFEYVETPLLMKTHGEFSIRDRSSEQWYLENNGDSGGTPGADIKAKMAWPIFKAALEKRTGIQDVVVAVIDSGVDVDHFEFKDKIWTNRGEVGEDRNGRSKQYNGIDDDRNGIVDDWQGVNFAADPVHLFLVTNDPKGGGDYHGTRVAGIIAAAHDSQGIDGIVPSHIKIMSLYAGGFSGSFYDFHLARAIAYAADNGASIINMSLGASSPTSYVQEVVDYASLKKGAILVSSANNHSNPVRSYPASYPHVMSVASTDYNDQKALHSNFNGQVDICAPGEDILTISGKNEFKHASGTSVAAPMAAGVLALVKLVFPEATRDEVIKRVLWTVDDISERNQNYRAAMGGGRLNAFRALTEDLSKPLQLKKDEKVLNKKEPFQLMTNYETLSGWPKKMKRGYSLSFPVISDLDRDGKQELFVRGQRIRKDYSGFDSLIYGLNHEGKMLPGWPKLGGVEYPVAAIGDLDQNGEEEIVTLSSFESFDGRETTRVEVWNKKGGLLDGWKSPHTVPRNNGLLLENLDDDPELEIVTASNRKGDAVLSDSSLITIFERDGTIVEQVDLISSLGEPNIENDALFSSDVDGHDKRELVVFLTQHSSDKWNDRTELLLLSRNGEPMSSFIFEEHLFVAAASAPLDEKKGDELIALFKDYISVLTFNPETKSFHHLKGWQKNLSGVFGGIALGDLDQDGSPEIFVTARNAIHAWHADGREVLGWGIKKSLSEHFHYSTPVLGDVDGDGAIDVVVAQHRCHGISDEGENQTASLLAFNRQKQMIPGWPKYLVGFIDSEGAFDPDEDMDHPELFPVLSDFDGDGRTDVIVLTDDFGIEVVKTAGYASAIEWPTYRGSTRYQGLWRPRK